MLLEDITNAILEIVRAGSVVDDEKIDYRLIESFVKQKRAIYIQSLFDGGKSIPEQMSQYIPITIVADTTTAGIRTTTNTLPKFLSTRFGPAIQEVTSINLNQYPFRVVNNGFFRVVGEGKFSSRFVYVTWRDGALKFKSKDITFMNMESALVKAVCEDPEEAYTISLQGVVIPFDQDLDQFPIDMQCFDFIKTEVINEDLRKLVGGISDTVNDASGDIVK
jgi:hypothetical protein